MLMAGQLSQLRIPASHCGTINAQFYAATRCRKCLRVKTKGHFLIFNEEKK